MNIADTGYATSASNFCIQPDKVTKMTALKKVALSTFASLLMASSAHAVLIDFSGFTPGVDTDPVVGSVSFTAGDPGSLHDTIVLDTDTPGNNYLGNGFADGANGSPAAGYDTYIGVTKTGTKFGSVMFDIAQEDSLPGGTTMWVEAYLGGMLVGSDSVNVADENDHSYHSLSISLVNGFDSLRIYDDLVSGIGNYFHIDNFDYTEWTAPPQPPAVPEPSVLWLLGAGLLGAYAARNRARVD